MNRRVVHAATAAAMLLGAGCPGLHSSQAADAAPGSKPKFFDVGKEPNAVLLRVGRATHEAPSAPGGSRGLTLPKFQWNGHGRPSGGAFEDQPSGRHQSGRGHSGI
jgi:hypothetical protein